MKAHEHEEGFTLIELTVSLSIMVMVGAIALLAATVASKALASSVRATTESRGSAAVDRLAEELRTEAQTALAIFVPAQSAVANVVFYSKDDAGRSFYWGYHYDPAAQTVSRVDLAGQPPNISSVGSHVVLSNVNNFSAQMVTADNLASQQSYGSALRGATGIARHVMALPGVGGAQSGVLGGNSVAVLRFANDEAARTVHVMAATVPSGFTITSTPNYHVVLYRLDTIHRSWLGLAQKTTSHIRARISVQYPGQATPLPWCDIGDIYKVSGTPNGAAFTGPDRGGKSQGWDPNDPNESAIALANACTQLGTPMPSYSAAPSANATPPLNVYDTPPPDQTPPPCSLYPYSPYCVGPKPVATP